MQNKKINFVFFGTSEEAVYALDALKKNGFTPTLIVTPPDRPAGRHNILKSPLAKTWAMKHSIKFLQPEKIDETAIAEIAKENADVFIVVGYGKILPQALIELPKYKTINVHPSLLPLYRGPTPIEAPILSGDRETGVSVMILDKEVDHGPIIKQETYTLQGDEKTAELTKILFTRGGELLAQILPDWIEGKIKTKEQIHANATFTKKLKKEDGLVILGAELPKVLYNKFRAYSSWPRIFFFKNNKRVIITDAELIDGKFVVKKVLPEGKKEITYTEFLNSNI
ncbi:MAG: methionyl-tRNA formyltransferase [bacterium]